MKSNRTTRALSAVGALSTALLCAATGGSTPSTLILGSRVELGPIQGLATNLGVNPVSGLIADLNGDGAPDIVLGINGTSPVVYLNNLSSVPFNNVSGNFVGSVPGVNTPIATYGTVVAADVNADGHPDLAVAGFNAPSMVYLNNGTADPFNGVTGVAIGSGDTGGVEPAFGDVNGDGYPDMFIPSTNHSPLRLYLTSGTPLTSGGYSTVQVGTDLGYGQDAKIADVNGDGKPDLIVTYVVGTANSGDPTGIAIYLNNGTSTPFANVTPIRLLQGESVGAIAVADLNGDGKMDLVATVSNATLSQNDLEVFLNTGSSSQPFGTAQLLTPDTDLGGGCLGVTVADVNNDGFPDLLFACTPPPPNASPAPANPAVGAIYLNNGTANPFANVTPVDIPAIPQSNYGRGIAAGPLVKNGPPDILIVDAGVVNGGQPGAAAYVSTQIDPNPVAQNDTATCPINKATTINVLANDSASTGQSLNSSSVTVATAPQHGTATVAANGSITYQPANNFTGNDSLQYTVRDALGAPSNAATLSIRVQPAPVATNDTATVQDGMNVVIDILSNDTSSGGILDASTVKIVVQPAHGSVTLTNGTAQYTPAAGYSGIDTFQYSVADNLGTVSNTATVSIDVTAAPSHGGGGALGVMPLVSLLGMVLASRRRVWG